MQRFRRCSLSTLIVAGPSLIFAPTAFAQGPAPMPPPVESAQPGDADIIDGSAGAPDASDAPGASGVPEPQAEVAAASPDSAGGDRTSGLTLAVPRGSYGALDPEPTWDARLGGAETGDFVSPSRVGATDDDVGHFPGSLSVPGSHARIRVGAIAHLSSAITWMALAVDDRFSVAAVPVDNTPEKDRGPRFHMSARESRLHFDFRTPSDIGLIRAYVETDFTASGNAPTLRHAYGQLGNLMVGHTWSLFMDVGARPELIDIEGPDGAIRLLHPSARYHIGVSDHVEIALAAESPQSQIAVIEPASGDPPPPSEAAELYPDIVGRLRLHGGNGHIQLAGILRRLGMERTDDPTIHAKQWAWGGSLSGVLVLPSISRFTSIRGQAALGRGIARYVVGTSSAAVLGQPLDGVYDAERNLMASLDLLGWFVAVQHGWTSMLRSTATAGGAFLNSIDEQPGSTLRRTHYFSLNLIWSPVESVDLGVEQLFGLQEIEDGAFGSSTQTQLAAKVRF